MKKTLAFILVCALLVSAFTLTAFAGTDRVGGTTGTTSGEFTGGNVGGNINVTVDQFVHKYAVDITYVDANYALPTITWDVASLTYVATGGNLDSDVSVIVENRSDLPVTATVAANDAHTNDGLTFTWADTTETLAGVAVDTVGATGTLVSYTFTGDLGTVSNTNLVTAVKYYTEGDGKDLVEDNKVVIYTYTVTIAK